MRSSLFFVSALLLSLLVSPSSALDAVSIDGGLCPLSVWWIIFGIAFLLLLLSVYIERGDIFASFLSLGFFLASLYTLPLTSETTYTVIGVWNDTVNRTVEAIQPVTITPDLTWLFWLTLGLFALATLRSVEALLHMIRSTETAEKSRRWW